jgi:[calcium/calmodulin-dependent protein kinase] kinase
LDQATAAAAVADVAAALAYCHWQGVAHCDVKPDKLLTGSDGITRLIDFSVSQLLPPQSGSGDHLLQDGTAPSVFMRTPGTPAYTAPECCVGGAFDGTAADVWCVCLAPTPPRGIHTQPRG